MPAREHIDSIACRAAISKHRPDSSPDDALEWTGDVGQSGALLASVGSSGADLIFYASRKLASDFGSDYRDLVKRAAMAGLQTCSG